MNTARAFGPAVVTGFPFGTHWVVRAYPFATPQFSYIGLVLGWAMLGVVPGVGVLHDSQAVRFRANSTVLATCVDEC